MMSRHALIAPHVQAFFAEHLCHHKRVSPQTIASYRDTFRLLLTFVKEATGKEPSVLHIHDLDAPVVLSDHDAGAGYSGQTGGQKTHRVSHPTGSRGPAGGTRSLLLGWAS